MKKVLTGNSRFIEDAETRRRGDNNAGEAALRAAHGSSEVALTSQITIEDGL
jgi:hypothetical protein